MRQRELNSIVERTRVTEQRLRCEKRLGLSEEGGRQAADDWGPDGKEGMMNAKGKDV